MVLGTNVNARHMARDEMEQITEDKWGEDIWGVEHGGVLDDGGAPKPPTLVFYFGQNVRKKSKALTLLFHILHFL